MKLSTLAMSLFVGIVLSSSADAENMYGLKPGKLDLKSVSALTFGPNGILFIGDAKEARIVAVDVRDVRRGPVTIPVIEGIDQKIAAAINVKPADLQVYDLAVNPQTGHVFLAVGSQSTAPRIVQIVGANIELLPEDNLLISSVSLPNPAEDKEVGEGRRRRNNRGSTITDLAFYEGRLLVSGLTADQAASNVWSIHFPFDNVDSGTIVEFFHAAHGRTEDYAAIRTFIPFIIDGKPNLLAGFVCTPLVRIPVDQLNAKGDERGKVVGTTVAELGNRNQPIDLISYKKEGSESLLLINNNRGVMKITTDGLAENPGLVAHVPDGNTAGQEFQQIKELEGAVQLDKVNDSQAALLLKRADGGLDFKLIELP
ncbi:MAG TPA: hypothetical protein VNQ76_04865 [Planctomicrobium sp.]|nr:hypothetical protein [Planctomicrobium sp.]